MSYMKVLEALEPGDYVTFNDSGGANAQATPNLCVAEHTNTAIIELEDMMTGESWRVKKYDDDLMLEIDRDWGKMTNGPNWRSYDSVETLELIAESESVVTA